MILLDLLFCRVIISLAPFCPNARRSGEQLKHQQVSSKRQAQHLSCSVHPSPSKHTENEHPGPSLSPHPSIHLPTQQEWFPGTQARNRWPNDSMSALASLTPSLPLSYRALLRCFQDSFVNLHYAQLFANYNGNLLSWSVKFITYLLNQNRIK